jgi:hypothetical protein
MDILLVADGRSPNTRRWVENLLACDYQVGLVSTFPCQPLPGLAQMQVIPVAFSRFAAANPASAAAASTPEYGVRSATPAGLRPTLRKIIARSRPLFLAGRYWLGPLSLYQYTEALRRAVEAWKPALVHALRIPFEGMLASFISPDLPLVASIWGNDLTLHAHGSAWMSALTQRCLQRIDGLIADARRDLRLAGLWGFPPSKPRLVVPGSGGIHLDEIAGIPDDGVDALQAFQPPVGAPLAGGARVINPRGFRPGSVRNDIFFQAIPLVLEHDPQAVFICPAMAGQPEAQGWVQKLGIAHSVRLLPLIPQHLLWGLFKQSQVLVSPSAHDGTPNSLLEGMACGCFPVAGDIESLREWITPGINGLLVEPSNPASLAGAILQALKSPTLRQQAAEINAGIVAQRADAGQIREKIKGFYHNWI